MFSGGPDYEEIERLKRQRRTQEQYQQEMREFGEDIGLIPADEYRPESKYYDPSKPVDNKQNFMLGLLGPAIDRAAEWKQEGATDPAKLQEEQDAFLEQQAVLQEQAMERDIRAGLYKGSPLGQMTQAERQQMYRQNAIDREQARWQRDRDAKERAKRRAQRRKELGME